MKHLYALLFLLTTSFAFSQIPSGYYDTATGTGYTLKTQLYNIINNHNDQGYNSMDGFIASYDLDNYYEVGSNTILDVYSENPSGTDPYTFTPTSDECGNYSGEGDCYNKEHVIPQSVFGSQTPMYSDAFNLLPTDGRVNGFRSNYPYGVVDDNTLVSQSGISNPTLNGSKLGNNLNSGYSAGYTGIVFEPIDEFKGDIARMYFYFATRYQNQISNWSAYAMFDGSSDKAIADPFLNILLTWHQNDPVSQKEIDRNNNIYYNYQGNRNPFVDHPEWVATIWSSSPDTESPTAPANLVASNPTSGTIDLSWDAATDNVAVASYDIYIDGVYASNTVNTIYTVSGLSSETTYCFTVYAKDAADNVSISSNQACETTTASGTGGSDCASEDFENIPASSSSYTTRTWTGSDGVWTATEARTDQSINGKAITIDFRDSTNGTLTSPTITGGIGDLTISTQRKFTGTDGTLDILVNGSVVGTVPYSDVVQTSTISGINVENNVTVIVQDNDSGSARIAIDDLSWTCYTALSIEEESLSSINFYPNPLNWNQLFFNTNQLLNVDVYNILGKKIISQEIDANNNAINLSRLSKGVYLVKISNQFQTVTKKLIKQ